jgi:hypothetical protein
MANILSMVSREPTESDFSELQGVLPEQFFGDRRGTSEIQPVRRLMIAMLVDAVKCFETRFDARQPATCREFAEVRSWIFSDADDGVFSFRAVCDALGVEPALIRKGLARRQEKRLAGERRRILRRSPVPTPNGLRRNRGASLIPATAQAAQSKLDQPRSAPAS